MKQRSRSRFLAVASAATLVLSACGGDDDNATAIDSSSASSVVDPVTPEAEATPETAADDVAETTVAAGEDDPQAEGDPNSMYCRAVRGEVDMPADLDAFDDIDVTDPDAMSDVLADAEANLDEAVEIAPDELRDDFRTVLEGSMTMMSELVDNGGDFTQIDASAFETPEFEAAAERVDTYNVEVCGYDASTATVPELDDAANTSELLTQLLAPMQEQMNLSDDQIACLTDKMAADMAESGAVPGMDAVVTYLTDCGIDPDGG